jgi:hypothetical protein
MNRWDCEHPGCDYFVCGLGGAIGLRAIGWYFVPGYRNNLFCPRHWPEDADGMADPHGKPCKMRRPETEATVIQAQIPGILENIRDSDEARHVRELFHHWDEVSDGV